MFKDEVLNNWYQMNAMYIPNVERSSNRIRLGNELDDINFVLECEQYRLDGGRSDAEEHKKVAYKKLMITNHDSVVKARKCENGVRLFGDEKQEKGYEDG